MKCIRFAVAALAVLGVHAEAFADLAPPPRAGATVKRTPTEAKLEVVVRKDVKKPTLMIPEKFVVTNAGFGPGRGGFGMNTVPMVVGGVALTLAFVSGGFWLVRRTSGKTIAMLISVSLLTAAGSALWADIPSPFPRPRPRPGPAPFPPGPQQNVVAMPANVVLPEDVVIQIVPRGDKITLIIPGNVPIGGPGLPGPGTAPVPPFGLPGAPGSAPPGN